MAAAPNAAKPSVGPMHPSLVRFVKADTFVARRARSRKNKDGQKIAKPVDVHVGAKVRARRLELGMSQEKLGEAIGLTFQQVQKYEKGSNRIGSSRLVQIANALDVPPTYFFEDGPGQTKANGKNDSMEYVSTFISSREGLALIKAFLKIPAPLRRSIVDLVDKISIHE